jgi:hypothetical protein
MAVAPIASYSMMWNSSGVYILHIFPFNNSMTVTYVPMGVALRAFVHQDHHSYWHYGQVIYIPLRHKTRVHPMPSNII